MARTSGRLSLRPPPGRQPPTPTAWRRRLRGRRPGSPACGVTRSRSFAALPDSQRSSVARWQGSPPAAAACPTAGPACWQRLPRLAASRLNGRRLRNNCGCHARTAALPPLPPPRRRPPRSPRAACGSSRFAAGSCSPASSTPCSTRASTRATSSRGPRSTLPRHSCPLRPASQSCGVTGMAAAAATPRSCRGRLPRRWCR